MTATTMTGTLRWIPVDENGPTIPFARPHISAFAYSGENRHEESAIVVRGLVDGAAESSIEAEWVDGYPALETSPGVVITLVASQRPIATISVTDVRD